MAAAAPTKTDNSMNSRWRNLLLSQEAILLFITVLVIVFIALRTDRFLRADNILGQARLFMEVALMALPMTYIIITCGIDLSVGSIFGMSAIILGFLWQDAGVPLELAIVIGILAGTIAGFINGAFIVFVGVPPLIMTLATLALYRGFALGISEARSARGFPDWFYQVGAGDTLGIPNQVWILVVAAIIFGIVLSRTVFGRWLYAAGNNETGARFAGIPVGRVKLTIYTLSGLMSGLAAWIFTSRISTTRSDMGTGLELDVIAAVVLGGTSIFGGSGSIWGTLIGLVLIQVLKNGLSLAGMRGDATVVVIGAILILSILVNSYIQRRFRN
ncbi:MAG: ABC transporter permease [Anaerolineae bacterium]